MDKMYGDRWMGKWIGMFESVDEMNIRMDG